MAIIVEDGTIVTGSNSFITRADYIAFAESIGVTITDDVTADEQLIKAGNFINAHENNLKGTLVERDQSMAYPRHDLVIDGWYWLSTEITAQVIDAQIYLALDLNAGEDLYNRSQNPNLATKREKIDGAVEVEYAVGGNQTQELKRTSKADSYMSALTNSSSMFTTLVRA